MKLDNLPMHFFECSAFLSLGQSSSLFYDPERLQSLTLPHLGPHICLRKVWRKRPVVMLTFPHGFIFFSS